MAAVLRNPATKCLLSLSEWRTLITNRWQDLYSDLIFAAASPPPSLDADSSFTNGFSPFMWTLPKKRCVDGQERVRLFDAGSPQSRIKSVHLCVDPLSDQRRRPNGVNRAFAVQMCKEWFAIPNLPRTPAHEYWLQLQKYKFVLSPQGNGRDCHRTYEALLAGAIPIVEEGSGWQEIYGRRAPILTTDKFSDLTTENLRMHYMEMNAPDAKFDFSRLFLSGLSPEEREEAVRRRNEWARLTEWGTKVPEGMWPSHQEMLLRLQAADNLCFILPNAHDGQWV